MYWSKFLLSAGLLLALTVTLSAQPPVQWELTFGGDDFDRGYELHRTADGTIYLKGVTSSFGAGGKDLYLQKIDEDGNLIWQQTYGGDQDENVAMSMYQMSDDVIYIGGVSQSFSGGDLDFYLVATDPDGNELWSHTYGADDTENCHGVTETSDGGIVLAGATMTSGSEYEAYVIKTDELGNQQWATQYGYSNHEYLYGIRQTSDGGYITAGWTRSFGRSDEGYLLRLDASGNVEWDRYYTGHSWDYFFIVLETPDGGFIAAGYSDIYGGGPAQVWVVKTDEVGNEVWNRYYGGSAEDRTYSLALSPNGGYYIGACTQDTPSGMYDVWLMEIDEAGNVLWDANYGDNSSQVIESLIPTENGGFLMAGYQTTGSTVNDNFYVLRLADAGQPEIELTLTPLNPPILIPAGGGFFEFDLEMTHTGPCWCTVDVSVDVTLPGGTVLTLLQRDNIAMNAGQTILREGLQQYVPATAPAGCFVYTVRAWDMGSWVIYDEDSFNFEKMPGYDTANHQNGWALYGWESDLPDPPVERIVSCSLSPNPFNPTTVASFELPVASSVALVVYDVSGREVAKLTEGWMEPGRHEVTFDGSDLPSGIYVYHLTAGDFTGVGKMVLLK